jgi:hypothetical protein
MSARVCCQCQHILLEQTHCTIALTRVLCTAARADCPQKQQGPANPPKLLGHAHLASLPLCWVGAYCPAVFSRCWAPFRPLWSPAWRRPRRSSCTAPFCWLATHAFLANAPRLCFCAPSVGDALLGLPSGSLRVCAARWPSLLLLALPLPALVALAARTTAGLPGRAALSTTTALKFVPGLNIVTIYL